MKYTRRWYQPGEGQLEVYCTEDDNGRFWTTPEDGEYGFQCNFCPITGTLAPVQIGASGEAAEYQVSTEGTYRCCWHEGNYEVVCAEVREGEFWVGLEDGYYNFRVNYCPRTGRKAPAQFTPPVA